MSLWQSHICETPRPHSLMETTHDWLDWAAQWKAAILQTCKLEQRPHPPTSSPEDPKLFGSIGHTVLLKGAECWSSFFGVKMTREGSDFLNFFFFFEDLPSLPFLLLIRGVLALLVGPGEKEDREVVSNFRWFLRRNSCSLWTLLLLCQISFHFLSPWLAIKCKTSADSKCSLFLSWILYMQSKRWKLFKEQKWGKKYVNAEIGAYHRASWSSWSYNLCK